MGRQKNISESEEEEYDDDMSDWGSDTDKDEDVNYNSSDRKQPAHHGSQQNGTYQDIRTNVNYNRNPTYRENDQPTSDNVSAGHESQNSRYPSYRPIFGDVNTLSEKRMYQYSFQRRTNPDPPYDIGRHARSNETTNRRNVLDPNETCPYLTANSEEDWETKSNTEFLNENWEDSAEEFDENVEQIEDTEYELSDKKLTCIAVNEDCLDTDTYNIENKTVSGINQEKITPTRKFYVDDKNYIQSNNVYIDFPDDKENKVDSASDTETKVNSYDSKNDTLPIKETSSQNTVKTTVECATVTPLQGSSQSASSSTESTTSLQVSSQSASSSTENTTPLQVSSESAFSSTENTTPPLQVSSQSASSSTGNTTTSLQVSCQSASENTTTPLQISSQSESSSTENTTNTTAPVTSDLNPDSISRNTVNNPRAYMTIIYRQQIENICQIMRQQLQLLEQLKESSLEELPISLPLGSNTQKTNSEMPQTATASVGSFGSQPLPPSILGASMLPFMQLPPVFPTTLQPQPVSQSVPNSHIPLHQVSQSNQLSLPVDIINNRLNFSATQSFNARYEAALLNISGMAASNPPMSNMVPVQQKPCSAETTTQIPTHKTNLPLTPQVPPYLNFPGVFPELNFLNPSFINPQSVMFSPGLGFPLQQLSANVSSAPTIPLQQSPINALGIPLTCESSVNPQIRNNLHLPQQSNSVGNTFIQGNEVKPETVPSGTFLQQPQVRASGFNTVQFPHIMPSLLATNLGQMTQIPVIVPSVQANRNSPESHILHDIPSQQVDTSGTTSIPSLPNFPIHPSLLGMGLMSPFGPPQMQLPIPNPLALGMQPQSITMDQLREALPNANIHTGPTMAGVNSSSNSNQTVEPRGRGRLNSKEYK